MAHIGFTPQSEHGLGGHIIQGRGAGAEQLLADAHAVEDAGAFAVVLEMVPAAVAARVTAELRIPTIGVGAGPDVDGQLLVWTDWAGLSTGRIPKFVKQYADLQRVLTDAATAFKADVQGGSLPRPRSTALRGRSAAAAPQRSSRASSSAHLAAVLAQLLERVLGLDASVERSDAVGRGRERNPARPGRSSCCTSSDAPRPA